jgi:glycosyltransferase involved in cell wall biosynthesis
VSAPILSVVIPTRNRCQVLRAQLLALERSEGLDGSFEVVVIDDGSTDDTARLLASVDPSRFVLKILAQPSSGPARARNLGIREATAERVLLLGDDTLVGPGTLAAHLAAAGDKALAVQGRIDWDPDQEITPVMSFLAPAGPQFYFKGLVDGQRLSWTQVLASNLSAPTRWFLDEPFDERFPIAGFEDTELAYRWAKRRHDAVFSEQAVCWHRHRYATIEPFLERQRRVGQAARLAVRLHPGLVVSAVLQPTLVGALFALRFGWRRMAGRASAEDSWDLRCRAAFLGGFLHGGSP